MESPDADCDHYLELASEPIKFESVSNLTNVFFDDSKQQVCLCYTLILAY